MIMKYDKMVAITQAESQRTGLFHEGFLKT